MAIYSVEVTRSISTTVHVEAHSAQAACDLVAAPGCELPDRAEWDGLKDWFFRATNTADRSDTHETD